MNVAMKFIYLGVARKREAEGQRNMFGTVTCNT